MRFRLVAKSASYQKESMNSFGPNKVLLVITDLPMWQIEHIAVICKAACTESLNIINFGYHIAICCRLNLSKVICQANKNLLNKYGYKVTYKLNGFCSAAGVHW